VVVPIDPLGEAPEEAVNYTFKQARSVKRGVCFTLLYASDTDAIHRGVSWLYNWGIQYPSTLEMLPDNAFLDYVPMAWNGSWSADQLRSHKSAHPECTYLLTFNEPNLTDQANLTPDQAARLWPDLRDVARELDLKIVAPAMNYGTLIGYGDPIRWLDDFFSLIPLSEVDAIAIHCYMNIPAAVRWYVERFRKYGKPIWMTEFCAWEGSAVTVDAQRRYMCQVVNYFESEPLIERYAWFMYDGLPNRYPYYALSSPDGVTALGRLYLNLSSWDQECWYKVNEVVPAAHYSQTDPTLLLSPLSNGGGMVEISDFSAPQWVEYQVDIGADAHYLLTLDYGASTFSQCYVTLNNRGLKTLLLPATGGPAHRLAYHGILDLPAGRHHLRFTMYGGSISMNWWKLTPE